MKYYRYEQGSYNLHIIKTNKFKTITVKVNFKREVVKDEITIRNLISDILIRSTKQYPTERLMAKVTEDLYGISYNGNTTISGRYNILSYEFMFLNELYTEKGMIEKSLTFIFDMLLNPNIINGAFDYDNYKISKENLKNIIESLKENPSRYSMMRLFEEMEPKNPISFHSDGYIEDLENITEKELYTYYKSILKSDFVDIFVIGNIEETKIHKIVEENLHFTTFKKGSKSHYIENNTLRKIVKTEKEKGNFTQSKLMIGFNILTNSSFEKNYVSYIYSLLLGGTASSKLFQNIREKYSLCYSIGSSMFRLNNMMVVYAGIDKDKSKKTISLIKKEIKAMVQGKFSDKDIMDAKVQYIANIKEILDSPSAILNMYISKEYLGIDLAQERIENISKVTKKDVINYAKKVKMNTIFILEGENVYAENIIS